MFPGCCGRKQFAHPRQEGNSFFKLKDKTGIKRDSAREYIGTPTGKQPKGKK